MSGPDELQRSYEALADRFVKLAEPRRRDHCLVLAADAAQAAGRTDEAERLRKRLLQVNPFHLLRPYTSMSEALQSSDVREYIADLRNQLPPESVQKLLQSPAQPGEPVYKIVHEAAPPTPVDFTPLPAIPSTPLPHGAPAKGIPAPPVRRPVVPKAPATARVTSSPTAEPAPPPASSEAATPAGRLVALLLFAFGLVIAAGIFFLTFVRPFLD
jgi:hypothetical protein